jgi:hypothetical protein
MMFKIKPVENDETAELSVTMLIAVLSCRGKRAGAHIKETFIKIRQAKAVSIKICRYDVARLGQYPGIL